MRSGRRTTVRGTLKYIISSWISTTSQGSSGLPTYSALIMAEWHTHCCTSPTRIACPRSHPLTFTGQEPLSSQDCDASLLTDRKSVILYLYIAHLGGFCPCPPGRSASSYSTRSWPQDHIINQIIFLSGDRSSNICPHRLLMPRSVV